MKTIVLLLLLTLAVLSCGTTPHPHSSTDTVQAAKAELTAKLDSIVTEGKIIGVGVAIANQNGLLYSHGFGYADKETQAPYTEHTLQHIASVSKTLIGIALFKAQEMGHLQLDDPIADYLPFAVSHPHAPATAITIRHLAQHTAGIQDTEQYMDHAWILKKDQDLHQLRTDYPAQRLNPADHAIPMDTYLREYLTPGGQYYQADNFSTHAPGTRYQYSNIGATLAALVLEHATGEAFHAFTQTHILQPLGMTSSAWFFEDIDRSRHSTLYRNDYSALPFYGAITYPDGMLISSPHDMGLYLSELIKGYAGQGSLLRPASYAEYFRPQLQDSHFTDRDTSHPYDGDYDPALFIGHSAYGYVGHSGGDAGVGTWMYFSKTALNGRFIVINTDLGADERAKELTYYAIWDEMEKYLERLGE